MQKDVLYDFYKALLKSAIKGWDQKYPNPAVEFTKRAKAGRYDDMFDYDYNINLNNVEGICGFWGNQPYCTGKELLYNAFADAGLDEKKQSEIASAFTEGYVCNHKKIMDKGSGHPLIVPYLDVPESKPVSFLQSDDPEDDMIWDTWDDTPVIHDQRSTVENIKEQKREEKTKEKANTSNKPSGTELLATPRSVYGYLRKHIYGQDKAVRAASMLLWNHVNGRKTNMVFIGPTGCGKTEIFMQLRNLYPDIIFIDGARLTQDGWKGDYKINSVLGSIEAEKLSKAIIVIDEADKLFEPKITSSGENASYSVQNELLRMIDSMPIKLKTSEGYTDVETKEMSFVFLGSFERLVEEKNADSKNSIGFGQDICEKDPVNYETDFSSEDLVEYAGVRREIAGRIGRITQLDPMKEEDFYNILNSPEISPVRQLSEFYGVKINMKEETRHRLAGDAAESRMGVRYLRSRIQNMLDEQMFENCNKEEYMLG